MQTTATKFKLDIFEGPLDLLLHLIKTNEMEISEISLSRITSQYLEMLRLMESLDLDVAGSYLVMAATLINIKLRSLLPDPEEEIDEDEEELDDFMSARALMQRLIEYRRFKEAAQNLGRQAHRQAQMFVRDVALPALGEAESDPQLQGDLDCLLKAFARVIQFVGGRDYHQVAGDEYRIEDKITFLRRKLVLSERLSLTRMFGECEDKLEAIVTLLAVLELCRVKEVRVIQAEAFDEVYLEEARGGRDAESIGDTGGEARQLERIEADIIANRTGLIDDGIVPEDDEDALLTEVLGEEKGGQSAKASAQSAVASTGPTQPPAKVIDLKRDREAEQIPPETDELDPAADRDDT